MKKTELTIRSFFLYYTVNIIANQQTTPLYLLSLVVI